MPWRMLSATKTQMSLLVPRKMTSALKRNTSIGVAILAVLLVSMSFSVWRVKANPSDIGQQPSTATTSVTSMISGGATASYTYDSYLGDTTATDDIALIIQYTATTTTSGLQWFNEFSINGSDWYLEDAITPVPPTGIAGYTHSATTTLHLWTPASTSTVRKIVPMGALQARYVRTTFRAIAGSGTSTLWATFLGTKQQPE